ncbi:hypothetical protein [Terrabacter sp. 2RAF25]|uniref:hypothetical protein n=1 Tax=Terrabacter sp. 2RAF25 TaxID=3232998 RepID=UPI003F9A8D35
MLKFRSAHPVWEAVWVLLTGPVVVFAVTDWFMRILPTPASIALSVVGIAGSVALSRRWDQTDGIRRHTSRGYRGRDVPQPGETRDAGVHPKL